jgi:hypothetical protein
MNRRFTANSSGEAAFVTSDATKVARRGAGAFCECDVLQEFFVAARLLRQCSIASHVRHDSRSSSV